MNFKDRKKGLIKNSQKQWINQSNTVEELQASQVSGLYNDIEILKINQFAEIDDFYKILSEIDILVKEVQRIPTNFIIKTEFLLTFINILQNSDDNAKTIALRIIVHAIFKSRDCLLQFISSNPIEYLFSFFQSETPVEPIILILNIFLKIIEAEETHNFCLETDFLIHLFHIFEFSIERSTCFEITAMVFEIIDSFVRNFEPNVIEVHIGEMVNYIQGLMFDSHISEYTLPILCDLCDKGFTEIIFPHNFQDFYLQKFGDNMYEKSFGYIARFILQIIKFDPRQIFKIPLTQTNYIIYCYSKFQSDILLLYLQISLQGEFMYLLVNSEPFLYLLRSDCSYEKQSMAMNVLWNGFANLRKIEDKFSVLYGDIFDVMSNVYDFGDEIIIVALRSLSDVIFNSQPNSIYEIKEEQKQQIINMANECVNSENEFISNCAEQILKWFDEQ